MKDKGNEEPCFLTSQYHLPELDILKQYDSNGKPFVDEREQKVNKKLITKVLGKFGISIKEIRTTVGPTISLYEIIPTESIMISKAYLLQEDICLSLAARGVRVLAPISDNNSIGIELPHSHPIIVPMRNILNSKKFQESEMELPIALGKTINNDMLIVDLTEMPHLILAASGGLGISMELNAIIVSLLYKKRPNEMKLVLIDPQKDTFCMYAPIAKHFMATSNNDEEAIITYVPKAIDTLKSIYAMMNQRYELLKKANARNIKEYNQLFANNNLRTSQGHQYMPYIVVVISEFGTLLNTENLLYDFPLERIAQLSHNVGIHMIISTFHISQNIVTDSLKAYFPGRIAFKMSSWKDSYTILNRTDAEQLCSGGDMLFRNGNELIRAQCAYIEEKEIEKVCEYITEQPLPTDYFVLPLPESAEYT